MGDWAVLFRSNDEIRNAMVQGLLEDSGIPFEMERTRASAWLGGVPALFPETVFVVPKDRLEEAREMLAQFEEE